MSLANYDKLQATLIDIRVFIVVNQSIKRMACILSVLVLTSLLGACASQPKSSGLYPDPFEPYNRAMFQFNSDFTNAFVVPATDAYDFVVPSQGRKGVHNFFNNLRTVPAIANDALQGNWRYFFNDVGRFILNTTLGIFGIFDVASDVGLYPHPQSFGLTLSKWGVKQSPYLVLPFFGPSTVSGAIGMVPDYFMSPLTYAEPVTVRNSLGALNVLQIASEVVPKQKMLTTMAIDPYIALRNAYMQNLQHIKKDIRYDGRIPASVEQAPPPLMPVDVQSTSQAHADTAVSGKTPPAVAPAKPAPKKPSKRKQQYHSTKVRVEAVSVGT